MNELMQGAGNTDIDNRNQTILEYSMNKTLLISLICEKDELVFHICPQLEFEYIGKIGNIELDISCARYEIFRLQRENELLRLNAKLRLEKCTENIAEGNNIALIKKQLSRMKKRIDLKRIRAAAVKKYVKEQKKLDESEMSLLNKMYRITAGEYHPAVTHDADIVTRSIFAIIAEAYIVCNMDELAPIVFFAGKIDSLADVHDRDISDISGMNSVYAERCRSIRHDIENIKSRFPYNRRNMLGDDERLIMCRNRLLDTLDELDIRRRRLIQEREQLLSAAE